MKKLESVLDKLEQAACLYNMSPSSITGQIKITETHIDVFGICEGRAL